ncbi:MAG: BMP family ABC transporter substrate-binding protein [Eubacterium sp.]|nr:BMP family ABC transporter substrate-binding protein [Eubacterium sp.]
MKKKILAMLLAGVMAFSMAACGSNDSGGSSGSGSGSESGEDAGDSGSGEDAADGGSGEETPASNINIAMITDSGDITDQSFNQTTYEASKSWAEENNAEFTYYKPDSDSDEARNASVDQAVAGGANVIVMPGYMFAAAVVSQSEMYPDVKFVALDVGAGDICEKGVGEGYTYNPDEYDVTEYYNTDNVYCCTYQEEVSGYMAGYAAVKLGYKHLGFLGGMSVPAVMRFGYGYIQGADAAAKEMDIVNDVEVEYVCGGQFYGDADITGAMDTWYGTKGVEVVFACGGGIFTSAAEAAVKAGGKVIGVDSDQAPIIDEYQEGLTVTSAMKGLSTTVKTVLTDIKDGKWSDYAGKIDNLGLVSENPDDNFVQLSPNTQWGDGFSEDDYKALVKSLYNGEITISNDITALPDAAIKVTDYGSIK